MVRKGLRKYGLSLLTLILIALVIFFARDDLKKAWELLWQVNIWVFLLIIPFQFLSYYASGAAVFAYLKARDELKTVPPLDQPKMALELNFVNHVFPSAGVSGVSYMTYRLGKYGINHARATLAQLVRFLMQFVSFAVLMVFAVLWVTFDGSLTRITILVASTLLTVVVAGLIGSVFLLGSQKRLNKFEVFVDSFLNKRITKLIRRSEDKPLIKQESLYAFFADLHSDYLQIKKDPRSLLPSFWWGIVFNLAEMMMYFVTFISLGAFVNPATILISLGLAGLAGAFLVTPGGAGGYEAAMILVLTSTGVPSATAVAGVLLARTSLIVLTIVSGYFFYNSAVKKMKRHGTDGR